MRARIQRYTFQCFFLFLLVVQSSYPANSASVRSVRILVVGDLYELSPKEELGGVAGLMTLVNKERREDGADVTLLFHSGDAISPSLVSTFDKGASMIKALNLLKLDAFVPGNHEFDFDLITLKARIKESRFPWIAANVFDNGKPIEGTDRFLLLNRRGLRIAVVGLTTPSVKPVDKSFKAIRITDPAEELRSLLLEIRRHNPDILIALTHLDFSDDLRIAREFPDINLILGGHDHFPVLWGEVGKPIFKPGSDGRWLGAVEWTMPEGKFPYWGYSLIPVDSRIPPDPSTKRWIEGVVSDANKGLGRVIAKTEVPLDGRRGALRTQESPLGNLVTDAMREGVRADIAFQHASALRWERIHPEGEITLADIYELLPFRNNVAVVELQGSQIREALEHSLRKLGEDNAAFLQTSGLIYAYDPERPPGKRVCGIWREKKGELMPLNESALYTVAIPDYIYAGGVDFSVFQKGKTILSPESGPAEIDLLAKWLEVRKSVSPKMEGRIRPNCDLNPKENP